MQRGQVLAFADHARQVGGDHFGAHIAVHVLQMST